MKTGRTCMVLGLLVAVAACSRGTAEEGVREPVVDGQFYPGEAARLKEMVEYFLAEGAKKAKVAEAPLALVAPHAGYQFSGRCAGVAYSTLKGRAYSRVIILAVNHRGEPFRGGSILPVDAYRTPLGKIPVDRAACDLLLQHKLFGTHPPAHRIEHSLEVQLPFLQVALGSFKLVPIVVGQLDGQDASAMADQLRKVVDDDTLVVASSDFTHFGASYGYTPFRENIRENIEGLDKGAIDFILRRDADGFTGYVERKRATICGRYPIGILLNLVPEKATAQLVNYYTSGDATGDYRQSVSYAGIVFAAKGQWGRPATVDPGKGTAPAAKAEPQAAAPAQDDPKPKKADAPKGGASISGAGRKKLLEIARATLAAVTAGKGIPEAKLDDAELQGNHGVFVTLKKKGELRGCIGNFAPRTPLYQTVAAQTRMSALEDRRFSPVGAEEVQHIQIEISILMPARPIRNPLDWEFGRHGLIVRRGWRQATFLPQVAENFNSREEMLAALCRKAGLPPDIWRDPETAISIYEALVFSE